MINDGSRGLMATALSGTGVSRITGAVAPGAKGARVFSIFNSCPLPPEENETAAYTEDLPASIAIDEILFEFSWSFVLKCHRFRAVSIYLLPISRGIFFEKNTRKGAAHDPFGICRINRRIKNGICFNA